LDDRGEIAFYLSVAERSPSLRWYAFLLYWIVPYCTWHIAIQYARIICEHSAVESEEEEYGITRTTIPDFAGVDLYLALQCRLPHRASLVSECPVLSFARPARTAGSA
jgi:hypothetical protein